MKCPKCGMDWSNDLKYCDICGALMPGHDKKSDQPYYSVKGPGTTMTFTRPAFYVYHLTLAAMWIFFIILAFVMYVATGDTIGLAIGVGAILISPALYWVVARRLRMNRRSTEKN